MIKNITIEEIKEEFEKYYYNNLIIETNRILYCYGNIICIENDVLVVVGKLLNNSYMVESVVETLKEHPQIKYVIWNKSETFTDAAQKSLRNVLDHNTKIKFIFITNDFDKFKSNITSRCLLVEK